MSAPASVPLARPYIRVHIDLLVPDTEQPRRTLYRAHELAESIARHGLLQPILVTPHGNKYLIVAGGRRFKALSILRDQERLESTDIPCCVTSGGASELLQQALVENVVRDDLPLWETGKSLEILAQTGMTLREIALSISRSVGYVGNAMLAWRGLCPEVQKQLSRLPAGTISVRNVLRLASMVDHFGDPQVERQQRELERLLATPGAGRRTPRNAKVRTPRELILLRYHQVKRGSCVQHLSKQERALVKSVLDYLSGEADRIEAA